jgi:8-oxo-dGTP diphosphatase
MDSDTIKFVAALIIDEAGRVLLVRKRGTNAFMQPGGKRDLGKDDTTDGFQYSTCQRIS